MTVQISMLEAIMGFKRTVYLLDGTKKEIVMDGSEVVEPSSWHVIEGKGMPIRGTKNKFGNLHIQFEYTFPRNLSPNQKEIINQIFPEEEVNELDKIKKTELSMDDILGIDDL
jgi:DnaJ-class molecular chaperone